MTTDPLADLLTPPQGLDPSGQVLGRSFAPIPEPLLALARTQWGLVSTAQCAAHHVDGDRQRRLVAAGSWIAVAPHVRLVVPDAVERTDWPNRTAQRGMVAVLFGGPRTLASGLAALSLAGVQGAPITYRPEVSTFSTRRRSVPAVHVRRLRAETSENPRPRLALRLPMGLVTAPATALAQVLPSCDVELATCLLDSGLHSGRLTERDLDDVAAMVAGRRGAVTLREARRRRDRRSESPFETRTRLQCEDQGTPPDDLQRVVRTREGGFIARCDLVWEIGGGRLLIIELDGAHHRKNGQIHVDNAQDNALSALGHRVFHFAWHQLATGEIWRTVMRVLIEEGHYRPLLAG